MTPSKAKGTAWETAIVRYLTDSGLPAVRKVLGGRFDKADLEVPSVPGIVIEAKNRRVRSQEGKAPSEKSALGEWVDEAVQEAKNAGVPVGVVWHHRYLRSSPGDGYVTMQGDHFVVLMLALKELREFREKAGVS